MFRGAQVALIVLGELWRVPPGELGLWKPPGGAQSLWLERNTSAGAQTSLDTLNSKAERNLNLGTAITLTLREHLNVCPTLQSHLKGYS